MQNDIRIDRTKLHPYLDYLLGIMIKYSNREGIYLIITEGFRTVQQQDELYAKGRTKEGKIVTNARGSSYQSQHQWGIAFDIAIKNQGHTWDVAYFNKVAQIAKKHCKSLGWGGDWTIAVDGIVDNPHFYLKKYGKNTLKLKAQYGTPDKFIKTWKKQVKGTKNGLPIRNKLKTKEIVPKQPNGTVFEVLWTHKKWSKVRYNGKVGYALTKFLGE
jgi:peptidoglycan L-alanyl-D-glutamate endopeptidase CwlK